MRVLDIPRDARRRRTKLHLKRDKPSTYARRRAARAYPGSMQRAGGDTGGPTSEQAEFAAWVKDVVAAFADPPRKWSLSRLARESRVHRNNIYGWMNCTSYPQAETVRRFCDNLGLVYSEPARILGWAGQQPTPQPPKDLPGFIERARRVAAHPKTSDRRRAELESQIRVAEAAQKAERDMEMTAESLLREALGESEDIDS